jgi:hypothetical protein
MTANSTRWEDWNRAIAFLRDQPGQIWIISPFITASEMTESLGDRLAGANILTTLDPHKLVTNSTSLETLLSLRHQGATVRLLQDLHAKVYLKRFSAGAAGFIGSANFTNRAERRNLEVMSGPVEFDSAFLEQLDAHWNSSNSEELTEEKAATIRLEVERLRALSELRIFSVEVQIFRGAFALKQELVQSPGKVRIDRLQAASVSYVPESARKAAKKMLDKAMNEALHSGSDGAGKRLSGEVRLYAVKTEEAARWFQARLQRAETEVRDVMSKLQTAQEDNWRRAFEADLARSLEHYLYQLPDDTRQKILDQGLTGFSKCMGAGEVRIIVNEYLPSWSHTSGRHLKELHALAGKQTLGM